MNTARSAAPHDTLLASLREHPFEILRPARQSVPFVFASPHSGRLYPASFVAKSRLNPINLRRSEDAFVDELFASVAELGAPLIAANFPRAYLDANRSPAELDAGMFEGVLPHAIDSASPRVTAGLGVIPRIVRDGAEIYQGKLSIAEAEERLSTLYRPYHAALNALMEETRAKFGVAVAVDCHSMPSAAAAPDIVIGDRYGVSAGHALMRRAERAFEARAFTVVRNVPYAGGYTTLLHGRPARGAHALQIEINRGLYLDEDRILPSMRFHDVKLRIADALRDLVKIDVGLLGGQRPSALAAE
ncbi:MAG: N-formylglutamate amidohydrolase [Proteobacteria bacterium]|nr:N-formylglutamate amidohydrolase [Pseudomonadota bacterium]